MKESKWQYSIFVLILSVLVLTVCPETKANRKNPQTGTWKFSWENKFVQGFSCTDGTNDAQFYFDGNGSLSMILQDNSSVRGFYQVQNNGLRMTVPTFGIDERTIATEIQLGLLVAFRTPRLFCHARAHQFGPFIQGRYQCPAIRYIPDVGYQENLFEFGPNGDVFRSNVQEYVRGTGNTVHNRTHGVYRIHENKVYMFFGDRTDERGLTGTFYNIGLWTNFWHTRENVGAK